MNRRILSFLMVLCLVFTMNTNAFASSVQVTEDSFFGKWILTSISIEGISVPASLVEMSLSFDIQDGKTIVEGSVDGTEGCGEAESYFDGTNMVVLNQDGDSIVLRYEEDGHISWEVEGMVIYFDKDDTTVTDTENGIEEVKKLSNVSETDFYGYWVATHAACDGIKLPIVFWGANISLTVSKDGAILEIEEGGSSEEIEAPTKLSGDVLIVNIPDMLFAVSLYSDGTASFELDGIEIYLKKESAFDGKADNSTKHTLKMSDYTYDEFIMYYTMTLGYGATLDALKNPKSAEFLGIAYDPESRIAYFCALAENDFGGKTKSYISYDYSSQSLRESDGLKYNYDSAPIHRTMADLQLFMDIAKTADESEVPVDDTAEKLAGYTKGEQTMYANFIEGYNALTLLYDNVVVLEYKYNSDDDTAYFRFYGYDVGDLVSTYARYNKRFGFDAHDAFAQQFENADTTVPSFEIKKYKDAIAPRITK
ncbi:MAG: hypothetical protein ACI4TD_08685 [Phocaeicola sp.]